MTDILPSTEKQAPSVIDWDAKPAPWCWIGREWRRWLQSNPLLPGRPLKVGPLPEPKHLRHRPVGVS
jgi:hypothetical protein